MSCRDWLSTLRRASYRGAPFWVEGNGVNGGRRLVVHEFPHRDDPYVEDLGEKAQTISVTAYVASDNADSEAKAVFAAATAGGAASLVLPMERFAAHCQDVSYDFTKDKLGYVAIKLTFVREGVLSAPVPLLALARAIEFAAGALRASVRSAFVSAFSGARVAGFVRDSAAGVLQDFSADLDAAIEFATIGGAVSGPLRRDNTTFYRSAMTLVDNGVDGVRLGADGYVDQHEEKTDAPVVDRVFDLLRTARSGMESRDAVTFLAPFATWNDFPEMPAIDTANRRREALNRIALTAVIRVAALGELAQAITQQEFSSRREAIAARALVAETFQYAANALSEAGYHDLCQDVLALAGQVTEQLSRQITDLAPVLNVQAHRTMPALYWSNRLYGTADRASELVARNDAIHPLFMPEEFEALAAA